MGCAEAIAEGTLGKFLREPDRLAFFDQRLSAAACYISLGADRSFREVACAAP